MKPLKLKKCIICKTEFPPFSSLSKTCSIPCSIESVALARDKQERRRTRVKKKALRERKKKLLSRSDHLRRAQQSFNAYIRERDKDENCISCQKPPKKRNAGHYKSVGGSPELRFNELNCHLQCEACNTYLSGNQSEYRKNLLGKIGLRNIEWVEGPHIAQNWSIEDIQEIKEFYKQKLKEVSQ